MQKPRVLTPKQNKVFAFICQRIKEGMPPTVREIAGELGFSSTGTVRDYLRALYRKGYLKRSKYRSRGIELAKEIFNRIPILANITAGNPNLAQEDIQGYIDTSTLLPDADKGTIFGLKVKGDSMIEAGVMNGDLALIRKQETAQDGDIVAALLENDEATLKRLRYKNKWPFLEPANKHYQPISKDFRIIGKLITIIRKY